jgi:hypothetical protein
VSLIAVLSFSATKLDVSGLLCDSIASLHIVACPLFVLTCITAIPGGLVHPDPDFRCRLDEQSSHFPPSVRPRVHEVSHQPAQRIAAGWILAVKGVSGTIPFGWCGRPIPLSAKTKSASYPWFSVAREERQSQPRLTTERQNHKSHAGGRGDANRGGSLP